MLMKFGDWFWLMVNFLDKSKAAHFMGGLFYRINLKDYSLSTSVFDLPTA